MTGQEIRHGLSSIGKTVVPWLFIHRQEVFAVASQTSECLGYVW
jgi:hypothetical protein